MTATESMTTLAGESGGGWTEETHNSLYPDNFNHGLASYIVETIQPTSVLEFGSGLGHLARHVTDAAEVTCYDCIEPNPIEGKYRKDAAPILHPIDVFGQYDNSVFAEFYDVVVSIEVAEHVPRDLHTLLFDLLVKKADRVIIFSGARVGQGGHGHIAERHQEDWRGEFLSRGCTYREDLSMEIRAACDKKNINHRQNLMVFNPSNVV